MGEFRKGREQVEEELKDMQDGEKADSTLDDEDDDLDELETETDKETRTSSVPVADRSPLYRFFRSFWARGLADRARGS